MKIISTFLGILILVLVLCFALSNQLHVNLGLWPLTDTLQVPLYLVGLAPLLFGLMVGGIFGWLGSLSHQWRARRLHKELMALKEQMGELQKNVIIQTTPIVPKPSFWKRKV